MGDFAHFLMTPIADDKIRGSVFTCQSSYRPEEAIFKPHYLKVKQQRYNITTELVPSCYGASLRIKYNSGQQAGLVLNVHNQSEFQVDAAQRRITGYVSNFADCHDKGFRMYVAMSFSKELDLSATGYYDAEGQFFRRSLSSMRTSMSSFVSKTVKRARWMLSWRPLSSARSKRSLISRASWAPPWTNRKNWRRKPGIIT